MDKDNTKEKQDVKVSKSASSLFYMQFPGRNVFYCGGRIITGPDKSLYYGALLLMLIPEAIFCAIICPTLFDKLTIAPLIISIYIFICCLVNFFLASFSDPGILPRKKKIEFSADNPWAKEAPPDQQNVKCGNISIECRYCDTCSMYRTPRSTHCSTCDNCVDRFDHHCPWIGNCVGRRNYRYFLLFVYILKFNCLYIITFSSVHLGLLHKSGQSVSIWTGIIAIALIIFSSISLFVVSSLGFFHLKLAGLGITTNEDIKNLFGPNRKNPWSRGGILKNYYLNLFPPDYPRYINFNKKEEEYNLPMVEVKIEIK